MFKHTFTFGELHFRENRIICMTSENPEVDSLKQRLAALETTNLELNRKLEVQSATIKNLQDAQNAKDARIAVLNQQQLNGRRLINPTASAIPVQIVGRYSRLREFVPPQPTILALENPPTDPNEFKNFMLGVYRRRANIFSRMSNCMQEYSRPYSRGGGSLMQKRQALAVAKSIRLCEYNPILAQIAHCRAAFESNKNLQKALGASDWITLISQEGWVADHHGNLGIDSNRRKESVQKIYNRIEQNDPEGFARMKMVQEGGRTTPVANFITGQEYSNRELAELRTQRLFNATRGGSGAFAADTFGRRAARARYGIEPYVPVTISSISYRPVTIKAEKGSSIPYRQYSPAKERLTRLVDEMKFYKNSGLSKLSNNQLNKLKKFTDRLTNKQLPFFDEFFRQWDLFNRNDINDYFRFKKENSGAVLLWVRKNKNDSWNCFALKQNGELKSLGTTNEEEGDKVNQEADAYDPPVSSSPNTSNRSNIPKIPDLVDPFDVTPQSSTSVNTTNGPEIPNPNVGSAKSSSGDLLQKRTRHSMIINSFNNFETNQLIDIDDSDQEKDVINLTFDKNINSFGMNSLIADLKNLNINDVKVNDNKVRLSVNENFWKDENINNVANVFRDYFK